MKKEKVKKPSVEEVPQILSPAQQVLINTAEKYLPTIDKDLAQFTACSCVSLNSERFYNIFSLCFVVQTTRTNTKKKKVLSQTEISNEEYLYNSAIAAILGNKVIDN